MSNNFFLLKMLYFIGSLLFYFSEIKICAMYVQKEFTKWIFLLKAHADSIIDSASFVSLATLYLNSNKFHSNLCTKYFYTLLIKGKNR